MKPDKPIISSRLDVDFYTFPMSQLVRKYFQDANVKFALKNRSMKVKLGLVLDQGALREELDHARTLPFSNTELDFLRGTNEYRERMFSEPYLEFLKNSRLPEYHLEVLDGDMILETQGSWALSMQWEEIQLAIVDELYTRMLMKDLSPFERKFVFATGRVRRGEKIHLLKKHPDVQFSEFGTRRRATKEWQYETIEDFMNELPRQFLGTSNTYAAMHFGIVPMGTMAHQLQMVISGLMDDGSDDWLAKAQRRTLELWEKEYGLGLSIFLPDTYGTDFFLKNLDPEMARRWKGFRQDSGMATEQIEKFLAYYRAHNIDSREKRSIPSDGLTVEDMIDLHYFSAKKIQDSYGWGTNATNDIWPNAWQNGLWYGPVSIVVKPIEVNGRGLVKLSDNREKATGSPENIERYKIAAGYTSTFREVCKY